jgi:hypothetical protein
VKLHDDGDLRTASSVQCSGRVLSSGGHLNWRGTISGYNDGLDKGWACLLYQK